MSELRILLSEAKDSLHDLDALLQRARLLDETVHGQQAAGREDLQSCVDELLRMIERIPKKLRDEERRQHEVEIEQLHRDMEAVRRRVEASIGRLEAACEQNVEQLADFIETLQQRSQSREETRNETHTTQLNHLVEQGRQALANKDYQGCVAMMREALAIAPETAEAISCLQEAQRKLEDEQLEEELLIHLDDLKKEASDLFDQERYRECAGLFKFLCELEPKNRMLLDYLELSEEKVREIEAEEAATAEGEVRGRPGQVTEEAAHAGSQSAMPASSEASALAAMGRAGLDAPPVPTQSEGDVDHEDYSDVEGRRAGPSLAAVFGAVAVAVCVLAGILLLRHSKTGSPGSLDLATEPPGVAVLVDGELRGETPLHLASLGAGEHKLSLAKEGYAPVSQAFSVSSGQPSALSVQLQPLALAPATAEALQAEAVALFEKGDLLEAARRCKDLLAKNPNDQAAAGLKARIRDRLWQQSVAAQRRGKDLEARAALQNLLRVSPQDTAALAALQNLKGRSKSPADASAEREPMPGKAEELRNQIASAIGAGNFFPPAAGNAWELVQRLGALAPSDSVFRQRMDQLHREAITQLQKKIQSKDSEGAKALGRQLQEYFPASAELKNLRESFKAQDASRAEAQNAWLLKLDTAMAHGNYVTPAKDNALAYCNRLLAMDAQNAKALALKRDITNRAMAQAKDSLRNEQFDDAQRVFSALLAAAQSEGKSAVARELQAQLERLEFVTYPVIHHHTLGSCNGRLAMNGYVVNYVPAGGSKDGFSAKLSELLETESSDKLKLQFKNKTYRFQPGQAKNKEESRERVQEMASKLNVAGGK